MFGMVILRMQMFQNLPVICMSVIYKVFRTDRSPVGSGHENLDRIASLHDAAIGLRRLMDSIIWHILIFFWLVLQHFSCRN